MKCFIFVIGILLCVLLTLTNGKFLWFEKAPNPDDRCTLVKYALDPEDGWSDVHPAPDCMTGGLIWYYTTGRIHSHFFLDLTTKQDFKICLTAGEANALYIWYDYKGKFWTPMGFPNYQVGLEFKERCKRSFNGTLDLFFEAPWYRLHYVSHVTWEITPISSDTPDDDGNVDFSGMPDFGGEDEEKDDDDDILNEEDE